MERHRQSSRMPKPDMYERVIQAYRDSLTDDEMEIFLALHEEGGVAQAAWQLDRDAGEIQEVIDRYIPPKKERLTNKGEQYRRRLSQQAIQQVIEQTVELEPDEVEILQSLVGVPNQVVAAANLGVKYYEFVRRYGAIRKRYDF